jgi:BlaI family penicillinase repressor
MLYYLNSLGGSILETVKLFDSELKIMEIVWAKEPISAKDISLLASETIGWNKNTTYTILKKLIEKKAIKRSEPNFICTSLVKKEAIQKAETKNLIDKLYNGSRKAFFAAFSDDDLSAEELEVLRKLIEKR